MTRMTLYDLAGQNDDLRFSPYCWRVKMALLHKGLEVDSRPWRFTEKETIALSGQGKVPVLVDGAQIISDSWTIINYLDTAYSDKPLLFADQIAKEAAFNLKEWGDKTLLLPLLKITILDIYNAIHEKDKAYFRETREQRLGMSLESLCDRSDEAIASFRRLLEPVRKTLEWQPFLSGEQAAGADYILFGAFQWVHCVSAIQILAENDPVNIWCQRMRALFNGYGEKAKRAI
ncbi:glutathione S-transferase N-terminal domain-containing protein [uncultured Endozoicomonas sp.]|uniref:glutathione S-transferase N-terminal domain-containing protein n=1 Tax=uncultured Endozoicomonas sp. TaxID=432652 RepID=UPI00261AD011|nr:glutathione S-transferase N-terminal domain-containing protein [uncultured Endozoicomonas sp.]